MSTEAKQIISFAAHGGTSLPKTHCLRYRTLNAPIGKIELCADDRGICTLAFCAQEDQGDASAILDWAQRELEEYFAGRRKAFSVPLSISTTPFRERVYRALAEIPYGETRSYGEIARAIGDKNAARAVGLANHCNPIPIFLPCHRVIGANGGLTGYAGGLRIKRFLLELEERNGDHV